MTDLNGGELSGESRERTYRRNFVFFLTDGILFTVAMSIISPTTLIPDFVRRLTNSEILIGLSGSMFEICWTLPQLFVARYIVRVERKKWWFVGPSIPVRFSVLSFGILTMVFGATRPELILFAFLICYGIAGFGDGLVGVPWADLIGSSLDNKWRARMFGLMSASAGLIMLAASPLIGLVLSGAGLQFPNNYALLFVAAGVLFAISIFPILMIRELPGGKRVEKTASLAEFLPMLGRVLRTDGAFRSILIARMLTSLFAMAGPFYIGFATVQLKLSSEVAVPTLLAMQTIGGIAGALIYTWLGSINNLFYIRLALATVSLLPISALLAGVVGPIPLYFGFLMSGLALSNLGLGYQNWIVSHANPEQRPIYVGLFNTISAITSLSAPLIGGLVAQQLGYIPLFSVSLLLVICALFVTLRFVRKPQAT